MLGTSDPEILWHSAAIYWAAGNTPGAKAALKASLEVDPSLAERADVKKLQDELNDAK